MKLTFYISAAVMCAIITVIGNIISAKIAQKTAEKTARETANKEIEKMERTWECEDLVSSDEEFAEMASLVSSFTYVQDGFAALDSVKKIAEIRSKESGDIAEILDKLYNAVVNEDYAQADRLLTAAIAEKRKIKQQR